MRHLISPLDFSVGELDKLLDLANHIEQNPEKYAHACDGKKIATLLRAKYPYKTEFRGRYAESGRKRARFFQR